MVKIIKVWFIKREIRRIEKMQYKVALNLSKSANRSINNTELLSELIYSSGYSGKIQGLYSKIDILNEND